MNSCHDVPAPFSLSAFLSLCHSILNRSVSTFICCSPLITPDSLNSLPKGRSWSSAWTCTVNGNVSLPQTCISAQHATVNLPRRSRRDGSEVRWLRTNLHTPQTLPSSMSAIVFHLWGYRYINHSSRNVHEGLELDRNANLNTSIMLQKISM